MRFALLINNVVVNVIIASQEFIDTQLPNLLSPAGDPIDQAVLVPSGTTPIDIMYTYDGTNFYPPVTDL